MSTHVPAIVPQPTFYGDYEKGKEPTNWIKNYQLSFPPAYTKAEKISEFELQCTAASPAEAWFTTLTPAETASWVAFKKRWPPPSQATLMVTQKRDRIQSVVLKEEEIRVMVEEKRGREWGHVKWAKKVVQMAQGFNDAHCHLLDVVLENTPEVLRDFLADNYSSCSDFETDVDKISVSQLLQAKQCLAADKKLHEDIEKLQSQITGTHSKTATPTPGQPTSQNTMAPPVYRYRYRQTPLNTGKYQQPPQLLVQAPQPIPQSFSVIQTPQVPQMPHAVALFSTPAPMGRGNLFYGFCGGVLQTPMRGWGGSIADHTRLTTQYSNVPHHPDSDTGKKAYAQQVQEWHTAHGTDTIPNSARPYPLKPGTAPLDSRECFNCGLAMNLSHQAFECMYPAVPQQETKWQDTVSHLVSRTLATSPMGGSPTNMQFVAPMQQAHVPYQQYVYYMPMQETYQMYNMMGNEYGPQA
ncbi:hypothetical protein EV424DRAFT_1347485 [Suillus variegatus]|nr:hypothetical protein EV424DRAFT_1347485 [Suillus variegatus]